MSGQEEWFGTVDELMTMEVSIGDAKFKLGGIMPGAMSHKFESQLAQLRSENERLTKGLADERLEHRHTIDGRDARDRQIVNLKQQLAAVDDLRTAYCNIQTLVGHNDPYDIIATYKQRAEAAEARIAQLEAGADKSLPMLMRDGGECWEVFRGVADMPCTRDMQAWDLMTETWVTEPKQWSHHLYRRRITQPKVLAEGWTNQTQLSDMADDTYGIIWPTKVPASNIPVAIVEREVVE